MKDNEQRLWEEWKSTKDQTKKSALVTSLRPIVTQSVNKYTNSGLPKMAIELEAKRLVGTAIENYDPSQAQLNTHVINTLKKLSRFVTTHQNVGHIPEHRALMIGRYNNVFSNLQEELGREPTVQELADALYIPEREVNRLQSELRNVLQMELPSADDEPGGFHTYLLPDLEDPDKRRAVEFVYFDADPINKKIMEFTIPGLGSEQIKHGEIKRRLKLTESEYSRRRDEISQQIKNLV